jgi:hypothetical protein
MPPASSSPAAVRTGRTPTAGSRRGIAPATGDHDQGDRHEGEPGAQRGVAEDVTQVQGQEEGLPDDDRGAQTLKALATLTPRLRRRRSRPAVQGCDAPAPRTRPAAARRRRTGPAPSRPRGLGADPGQAVDEGDEPCGDGDRSRDVEAGLGGGAALGHDAWRGQGDGDPDRDVDEEHPAPAGEVCEEPADDHAGRGPAGGDRAPDPEGPVAVGALAEAGGQQGQRGGRHHRPAQALQRPRGDELPRLLREPAQQGRDGEHTRAQEEEPAPAPQVAGTAEEDEEAAEDQRVRGDDPLQVPHGEAEVGADGRQRDVGDRHVQHEHELRQAEHEQEQPRAAHGDARGTGGAGTGIDTGAVPPLPDASLPGAVRVSSDPGAGVTVEPRRPARRAGRRRTARSTAAAGTRCSGTSDIAAASVTAGLLGRRGPQQAEGPAEAQQGSDDHEHGRTPDRAGGPGAAAGR